MGIVCNNISFIHRSRSAIWTYKKLVWLNVYTKMSYHVGMRMWWHAWMRVCWHDWIIMINIVLMYILSIHTPCNRFLSKHFVGNVYSTTVPCIKLDDAIPFFTSVITITIKTRWYNMITWMMGGRRADLRPRFISTNTINTFCHI